VPRPGTGTRFSAYPILYSFSGRAPAYRRRAVSYLRILYCILLRLDPYTVLGTGTLFLSVYIRIPLLIAYPILYAPGIMDGLFRLFLRIPFRLFTIFSFLSYPILYLFSPPVFCGRKINKCRFSLYFPCRG